MKWHGGTLGTVEGREQAAGLVSAIVSALPDLHNVEQDIIGERDIVAVRAVVEGTHKGDLLGIPASGRHVPMDHRTLVSNIVATTRLAKLYALPIVLSTVNVKTGLSAPTIHQLAGVLTGIEELDRTTINAWEDEEFVTAVKATGRKKLIMAALWTEAGLTFPALDALREGCEVYPVVDAVGGTSVEAHRAGLERIVQAGAHPTSVVQLMCELQRDWARTETVQPVGELLFALEGR